MKFALYRFQVEKTGNQSSGDWQNDNRSLKDCSGKPVEIIQNQLAFRSANEIGTYSRLVLIGNFSKAELLRVFGYRELGLFQQIYILKLKNLTHSKLAIVKAGGY